MNEIAKCEKGRKRPHKAPDYAKMVAEAERIRNEQEKLYVASQPHRGGDMSAMAGSELGRFIVEHFTVANCLADGSKVSIVDLQRETMDACESYARVWGNLAKHQGIPVPHNFAWDLPLNGDGTDRIEDLVLGWRETRDRYETALKCAGAATYRVARDLILFDLGVPFGWHNSARRAVQCLWSAVYR